MTSTRGEIRAFLPKLFLFWILVLFLLAGAHVSRVWAQEDFGTEADTTAVDSTAAQGGGPAARRARADSTNALFRTLHPSYNTDYTVQRQTTAWNQNFNFGTKIGFFNFENRTVFRITTDNGRNETRRDGNNVTTFRLLKVPLNATLNLQRSSVNRPGEERSNDNVALFLSTRDLQRRILGVDQKVSFSGGLSHRGDESLLNQRQSKSLDSGLNGKVNWNGTWKPVKELRLDGTANLNRDQKNSRLEQDTTTVSSPTANVDRMFDIKAHVEPWGWITSDLGATSTLSENESYLTVPVHPGEPPARQLERRFGNHRLFTAKFALLPNLKDLHMTFDVSKDVQDLDYRIRKDFAYTGDNLSWTGNLKAKWQKTDIDISLSNHLDQMDRATSTGTDTQNNMFEGKLSRRIYSKLSARLNWLVRANQLFFDDASLDRDELRTKLQPTLTYTPSKKWTVNLTYIGSTSRRVEVNPKQALQTRKEDDYTVDMGIGFQASDVTHLSQIYSIKALYTTFDYNPTGDRLLSTQRITSTLDTQLGPRCDFSLEHIFTLQDSGPFRYESDGTRVFARNLRNYRQEMNASVKYKLNSWATALLDSRFSRRDDVNEYTDLRVTVRNITLQTGVNVEKTLRGSVAIQASGQYIQSNVQDAYWTISSALKKDF